MLHKINIGLYSTLDVTLAMITDKEYIGVLKHSCDLKGTAEISYPTVYQIKLVLQAVGHNSVLVPAVIHISVVNEQHLRRISQNYIASVFDQKIVDLRMYHKILAPGELVGFCQQAGVGLNYLKALLVGSDALKRRTECVAFLRHPVFCNIIIDRRVVAGHRPEYGGC